MDQKLVQAYKRSKDLCGAEIKFRQTFQLITKERILQKEWLYFLNPTTFHLGI